MANKTYWFISFCILFVNIYDEGDQHYFESVMVIHYIPDSITEFILQGYNGKINGETKL